MPQSEIKPTSHPFFNGGNATSTLSPKERKGSIPSTPKDELKFLREITGANDGEDKYDRPSSSAFFESSSFSSIENADQIKFDEEDEKEKENTTAIYTKPNNEPDSPKEEPNDVKYHNASYALEVGSEKREYSSNSDIDTYDVDRCNEPSGLEHGRSNIIVCASEAEEKTEVESIDYHGSGTSCIEEADCDGEVCSFHEDKENYAALDEADCCGKCNFAHSTDSFQYCKTSNDIPRHLPEIPAKKEHLMKYLSVSSSTLPYDLKIASLDNDENKAAGSSDSREGTELDNYQLVSSSSSSDNSGDDDSLQDIVGSFSSTIRYGENAVRSLSSVAPFVKGNDSFRSTKTILTRNDSDNSNFMQMGEENRSSSKVRTVFPFFVVLS